MRLTLLEWPLSVDTISPEPLLKTTADPSMPPVRMRSWMSQGKRGQHRQIGRGEWRGAVQQLVATPSNQESSSDHSQGRCQYNCVQRVECLGCGSTGALAFCRFVEGVGAVAVYPNEQEGRLTLAPRMSRHRIPGFVVLWRGWDEI